MYYYSPFRKNYPPATTCPFCDSKNMASQQIFRNDGTPYGNEHWDWIVNLFPKFEGHTMLVPKRHFTDLIEETPEETLSRHALFREIVPILKSSFLDCGIEYFAQNGSGSESSVPHVHWHVVPAAESDELRSFEKLGHFYTTKPDEEKVLIFPKEISISPEDLKSRLEKN